MGKILLVNDRKEISLHTGIFSADYLFIENANGEMRKMFQYSYSDLSIIEGRIYFCKELPARLIGNYRNVYRYVLFNRHNERDFLIYLCQLTGRLWENPYNQQKMMGYLQFIKET